MDQKLAKNRVFWICWKILWLFILNLFYNENLYYLLFLHKSHIWENFCDAIILFRPTLCSMSMMFKCHSGSSWKDPMKWSVSILLSWHLSECFLGIGSLYFSEFWHGARNPYEVVHNSLIFWKNFFCPKDLGTCPKIGFFEFKEKFGL